MPRRLVFFLFFLAIFLQAGAYGLTFMLPKLFSAFGPGGAFFGPVWRAVRPHALAGVGATWGALIRRFQHPTPEPSQELEEVPEAGPGEGTPDRFTPEFRAAWGTLLRAYGLPRLEDRPEGWEELSGAAAPPPGGQPAASLPSAPPSTRGGVIPGQHIILQRRLRQPGVEGCSGGGSRRDVFGVTYPIAQR